MQKHPGLVSLRPYPAYPDLAHLADDDDDEDRDDHDDDNADIADPGRSSVELSARLRVWLQWQMRGHRRVSENAESLRQIYANVYQQPWILQVCVKLLVDYRSSDSSADYMPRNLTDARPG